MRGRTFDALNTQVDRTQRGRTVGGMQESETKEEQ
jgi:hypothetical protein